MNRRVYTMVLAGVLCIAAMACADGWEKFVAADGSFSLHHPAGWDVNEQDSAVLIESGDGRQIAIIAIPYQRGQSAREHALRMVGLLAAANPGLTATNWRDDDGGNAAYAEVGFTEEGVPQAGDVVVLVEHASRQALWFSHSAPAAGYDRAEAVELLQAVIGSVSLGDASQPPAGGEVAELTVEAREITGAFLFILEFSLGEPLNLESEQMIVRALTRDWDDELQEELAMYPPLARHLMSLDQEQLDELQRDLHGALREWLNESDPNDPVVAIVRERLEAAGRFVAAGEPPLTAAAAQAYAELIALSELLQDRPDAGIDAIRPDAVGEIRGQLIAAWPELSAEQRGQVLTAPGVWGVLRHALRTSGDEQEDQARAIIAGLTEAQAGQTGVTQQPAAADGDDDVRTQMTRSFVVQETLRQAQQHTFNTWRWSMGYCRGPMGF
ncbi:MAG: hypothetical protein ACOX9R_11105 [Armatimonadota bacterium]|jgi:hypothetical protein